MSLGDLVVTMAADMARFQSDMRQANNVTQNTMRQMQTDVSRGVSSLQRSFADLGNTVAGALSVASVVAFATQCTNAALAAEKLNMQFKASTSSAAVAAKELAYIKQLSATLGLEMQTTATAYGKFLASTRDTAIEGEEARKVFEGVSEASAALGLTADETSGIFMALSQMMSKGKVSAEELTGQLGERLPGALKLAATSLGLTTAELMKQMQEGKVMSADLLPKLAAEMHKTYGTAAKEASDKGRAGLNLFKNEVFETAAAIGDKLLPFINSMSRSLADALKTLREEPSGGLWNFLEPFTSNPTGVTKIRTQERFRLPGAGEGMGAKDREARIAARLADQAAIDSSVDPQMARVNAEARGTQAAINAQRAATEKAAAAKDASAKADKAAQSAAEQLRQEYNRGVRAYNSLVDTFNNGRVGVTELEKALAKVNEEVAELSKSHPEQAADAQRLGEKIKQQLQLAEARKLENAQIRDQIDLMEELTKDAPGFASQGLSVGFGLTQKKSNYSLLGDSAGTPVPGGKFSLNGASESSIFGGGTGAVSASQAEKDELLSIEEQFQADMLSLKFSAAQDAISIAQSAFEENKGMSFALLAVQKALAIQQILISTEVAAAGAIAANAALGPAGVAAGTAQAAAIRTMGYVSMGLVIAAGAMEAISIAGARAAGGPVVGGQTYLVGEKGPELFTAGASGYVTPNNALGGASVTQQITIDARGTDAGVINRIQSAMKQAKDEAKAEILASMNRGGTFAVASGRTK